MTRNMRGYLFVILAALLWGLHGALAKFLFIGEFTPALLLHYRLTLSALILGVILIFWNRSLLKISVKDLPLFVSFGALGIASNFFLYYFAIQKITVAMAIFLQYLSPSLIAIYWTLRGTKPSRATVMAILTSLAGCFLVVKAYDVNFLNLNGLGVLAGLGSAVAWAWQSLHAEYLGKTYKPTTLLFYGLFFAALLWNLIYSPSELLSISFTSHNILGILYVVILGTIVPTLLFFEGITIMGATRASVTATVEPIAAAVFAYFLVNECLELPQILGGILVIGSIALLQTKNK